MRMNTHMHEFNNLTVHAGLEAVVTRYSWYQGGQEPLAGGVIVAEGETNSCHNTSNLH